MVGYSCNIFGHVYNYLLFIRTIRKRKVDLFYVNCEVFNYGRTVGETFDRDTHQLNEDISSIYHFYSNVDQK